MPTPWSLGERELSFGGGPSAKRPHRGGKRRVHVLKSERSLARALWRQVRERDRQLVAQFRGSSRRFGECRERARKSTTGWLTSKRFEPDTPAVRPMTNRAFRDAAGGGVDRWFKSMFHCAG